MPVVDIKGVGKAQFPVDMPIADIRTFLRNKYFQDEAQGVSRALDPAPQSVSPYEPSLAERAGTAIGEGLKSSGLVSDTYGAQRIGRNVSVLGEMLPGIGDATAGDEFGRAVAQGDKLGMGLAALGAIPVAGDAAKKGARKVFHGSDRRIDEYLRGTNTKGRLGAGVYFGDEKKANVFAKMAKIKKQPSFLNEAEIVSDNPKIVTEDTLLQYPQGGFPAEAFEKQGYTGIQLIDENTGRIIEETVFDPKNIKSLNPKDSATAQSLPMDKVKSVEQLSENIKSKKGIKTLSLYEDRKGNIKLDTIIVDKGGRGSGVGSEAMEDIIKYADENNKLVKLTPAVKDDYQGTTSQARLKKFYKRFGFVENKGRNKDYAISELMYREPKAN